MRLKPADMIGDDVDEEKRMKLYVLLDELEFLYVSSERELVDHWSNNKSMLNEVSM